MGSLALVPYMEGYDSALAATQNASEGPYEVTA